MGRIVLSADSACDLSRKICEEIGLHIVPITIILGSEERADGIEIQPEEIYAYVEKTGTLPKTSAISSYSFKEHFQRIRQPGDSILHFSISSKLSACHQNAVVAAGETENIHVIDGESLSTGTALLILKAKELIEKGYSAEQIAEECRNTIPFVQASFVVDTLEYLHKGGRCSGLANFVTGVFKIHPMLQLQEGSIKVAGKFRGSLKLVLGKYIEHLAETMQPDLSRGFLTYTQMDPDIVDSVREKVNELFPFKQLIEGMPNSTVNCHCGKGTLGLLFINKEPIVKK